MGAVVINYTTGQGQLKVFAQKVAKVLDFGYKTEHTSATEERPRKITAMLYAAAHPVSKHNMLYILDRTIPSLSATWAIGTPKPTHGGADKFLRLRVGGIPAGTRKLHTTLEACKRIAADGLLVAIPGISSIPQMNAILERVKSKGVAVHVGESYYLCNTAKKPYHVDQNRNEFRALTV